MLYGLSINDQPIATPDASGDIVELDETDWQMLSKAWRYQWPESVRIHWYEPSINDQTMRYVHALATEKGMLRDMTEEAQQIFDSPNGRVKYIDHVIGEHTDAESKLGASDGPAEHVVRLPPGRIDILKRIGRGDLSRGVNLLIEWAYIRTQKMESEQHEPTDDA